MYYKLINQKIQIDLLAPLLEKLWNSTMGSQMNL